MAAFFIFIGVLIFCAHVFAALFSKRRIPDVLFLVVIGIVLGPLLGVFKPDMMGNFGPLFSSLTLILILFDGGVDMSIDALRKYWRGMVQVTFFSFVVTMGLTGLVGRLFGMHTGTALMMGAMLGGTAAAIVIPLVKQMRLSEYARTVLSMESALSAVLCMVVALAFMDSYGMGSLSVPSMLGSVISSFLMALGIGVVGGVVWSSLLDRVRTLQNSMFLTPAFVFVLYGITESLGYSGAIAALAFGLVLGNPDYFEMSFLSKFGLHQMSPLEEGEKSFFKEFVFILKTYFFVYIGICIPFTDFHALLYGAVISAALFVIRFAIVGIVGRKNTKADRLTVSMMIPKGLVSAVLASMPEQLNAEMGYPVIECATEIKNITYAVIFCSIIICSLLVLIASKRLVKTDDELDWSGHIAEPDKTKGEQHEIL